MPGHTEEKRSVAAEQTDTTELKDYFSKCLNDFSENHEADYSSIVDFVVSFSKWYRDSADVCRWHFIEFNTLLYFCNLGYDTIFVMVKQMSLLHEYWMSTKISYQGCSLKLFQLFLDKYVLICLTKFNLNAHWIVCFNNYIAILTVNPKKGLLVAEISIFTAEVFFTVGLCWPQRHFEKPQLFYLNTEKVVKQYFSNVLWWR